MYSVAVSLTSHDSMIDGSEITRVRQPLHRVFPLGEIEHTAPGRVAGEAVSRSPPYCPTSTSGSTTCGLSGNRSSTGGSSPAATLSASIGDSWNLEAGAPRLPSSSSSSSTTGASSSSSSSSTTTGASSSSSTTGATSSVGGTLVASAQQEAHQHQDIQPPQVTHV